MTGTVNLPLTAHALWYVSPGKVDLHAATIDGIGEKDVLVRTLFSAASRGTERQVLMGRIPSTEWQRMRAPLQEGDFPFPVKYGYCAVGRVEAGSAALIGRDVFVLHPHQDWFAAPEAMAVPLPPGLPPRRATLAANMETALNALWDSGAAEGDTVAVVGAGVVGLLISYLAAGIPGAKVTVADIDAGRRSVAEKLGLMFSHPGELNGLGARIVFHTSASEDGLAVSLSACGFEGTVVEVSWYGDRRVSVPLGGAFHSQRLKLVSSQVGHVAPSRRQEWTHSRRMEHALTLLASDRLDHLLGDEIAFEDAPRLLPALLNASTGLAPLIRYP